MSFHRRAWHAAAAQYGSDRSEKYGRIARAIRVVKIIAVVMLVAGIFYLWRLGQHG